MKYFILFFLFFICINCKGKLIEKIPDCIISELGQFKYIQIKVIDKNNINICGFSTAYGKARHIITSAILSKYYPNHKITNDERLFIF